MLGVAASYTLLLDIIIHKDIFNAMKYSYICKYTKVNKNPAQMSYC